MLSLCTVLLCTMWLSHCRSYQSQQTDSSSSRDVTHWQNTGTTVSRLVASLRDMTDKLQNAYSGRDVLWSSAGQ